MFKRFAIGDFFGRPATIDGFMPVQMKGEIDYGRSKRLQHFSINMGRPIPEAVP
jgi:hypothetical protein